MKTITEFTSIEVKQVFNIRQNLLQTAPKQPAPVIQKQPVAVETTQEEPSTNNEPAEQAASDAAPAPEVSAEPVIKTPDELLVIRQEERRQAWEATLGQIKEPFLTQLKEKFKWSDDRAAHAFSAIDLVSEKSLPDLRLIRIIKMDSETETVPHHGKKVGELVYITEFYPRKDAEKPQERKDGNRGKFKGKGGKRPFNNNRPGAPKSNKS